MTFSGAVGEIIQKYESAGWEVVKIAISNRPARREAFIYAMEKNARSKTARVGRLAFRRDTGERCFDEFFLNIDDLEAVAKAAGHKRLQMELEFLNL